LNSRLGWSPKTADVVSAEDPDSSSLTTNMFPGGFAGCFARTATRESACSAIQSKACGRRWSISIALKHATMTAEPASGDAGEGDEMKDAGQTTVIELMDHHDERYMLEIIQQLAAKGGAHVHFHDVSQSYVISAKPLSVRQVNCVVKHDHEEQAREMLKDGESPEDVWNMLYISGQSIGRLAKQEGIKLPHAWFAKALANSEPEEPHQQPSHALLQ
jgi:hypothetical protein